MSMTESTIRQPSHAMTTAPRPASLTAGARPRAIVPSTIEEVWRISQMAIKSKLNPYPLDTPEKCAIVILHGLEVGLPPMMALQRITVIQGRPAIWGDAVPGIALGTGQVEDIYERLEGKDDARTAICRVKRKNIKTPAEVTFSVADAKRADLWDTREKVTRKGKDGSKYEVANDSPWHCYPDRMLQMRARVAFRNIFADAFSGLYIAEELVEREPEMRDVTTATEFLLPRHLMGNEGSGGGGGGSGGGGGLPFEPSEQDVVHVPGDGSTSRPLPPLARGPAPTRQAPPGSNYPAFREWADTKLSEAKATDTLAEVWTMSIEPYIEELDDHDQDNLNALYQEHEERVTT